MSSTTGGHGYAQCSPPSPALHGAWRLWVPEPHARLRRHRARLGGWEMTLTWVCLRTPGNSPPGTPECPLPLPAGASLCRTLQGNTGVGPPGLGGGTLGVRRRCPEWARVPSAERSSGWGLHSHTCPWGTHAPPAESDLLPAALSRTPPLLASALDSPRAPAQCGDTSWTPLSRAQLVSKHHAWDGRPHRGKHTAHCTPPWETDGGPFWMLPSASAHPLWPDPCYPQSLKWSPHCPPWVCLQPHPAWAEGLP